MLVGASPGLADAAEREARRRADEALADRIEAIGVEAFATEWGAPGAVRRPGAAGRRRRARRPPAQHARGARRGAARPRHRRHGRRCGTGCGELAMPVTLRGRRARREVPRDRRADGRRAIRDCRVAAVAGAGHAAQLERPEAVAVAIAAGAPGSRQSADLVDRAERERDDVQVAVGAGLDVGRRRRSCGRTAASRSRCPPTWSMLSATPVVQPRVVDVDLPAGCASGRSGTGGRPPGRSRSSRP